MDTRQTVTIGAQISPDLQIKPPDLQENLARRAPQQIFRMTLPDIRSYLTRFSMSGTRRLPYVFRSGFPRYERRRHCLDLMPHARARCAGILSDSVFVAECLCLVSRGKIAALGIRMDANINERIRKSTADCTEL